MSEYVFDYDGWADEMRETCDTKGIVWLKIYFAIRDVMHGRKHEPIVRCKDCKQTRETLDGILLCEYWAYDYDDGSCPAVDPDGFCSNGEQREGA